MEPRIVSYVVFPFLLLYIYIFFIILEIIVSSDIKMYTIHYINIPKM